MEVELFSHSKGLIHSLCLGFVKLSVSSILHEKITPMEVTPPIFPKFQTRILKYPNSGGLPQPQPLAVSFETWDMIGIWNFRRLRSIIWVSSVGSCAATVG